MKNKEVKEKRQGIKNRGITLIALVVTIVVLLILAAVSISMLGGENGIITQAIESKDKTDIAEEKEKVQLAVTAAKGKTNWGEITEENLAEELTKNIGTRDEDYTLSKEGESFLVTYTDSNTSYLVDANGNIGEIPDRTGLKVGDYINYIPDENTTGYTADKLTSSMTGSTHNTITITQDQQYAKDGTGMTWQILRIYDNGSIDLIGSATNQTVYLESANGYNNGVTVMNDICETLYSRGNIKARSVNCEDIEYWLTDAGKAVRDTYTKSGVQYGNTQTYTMYRKYPKLYAQEIGAGIDTETVNTIGLGISEEGTASGLTQASSSLTVTQTYWNCDMNSTNFGEGYNVLKTTNTYLLASRFASSYTSTYPGFGLRYVNSSRVYCSYLLTAYGDVYGGDNRLRPVVSLPSSVQIENCTGTNSVDNMHKITQY